jgi:hypothetical protein
MKQKGIDKNFFTEGDTPVPLPPADMAWEQMHQKLNKELPQKEKRKRRVAGWLFLLLLIIISGVYFLQYQKDSPGKDDAKKELDIISATKIKDQVAHMADGEITQQKTNSKDEKSFHENTDSTRRVISKIATVNGKKIVENIDVENGRWQSIPTRSGEKFATSKRKQKIHKNFSAEKQMASADDNEKKKGKKVSTQQYNVNIASGEPTADSSDLAVEKKPTPVKPPIHSEKKATADKDSSTEVEEKEKEEDDATYKVRYGLQWNMQLPLTGSSYYFTSANGKNQPWLVAVPAIWIAVQQDRSMLGFEINPLFTFLLPAKTYRTITGINNTGDSIKITNESRQLNKLFGSAFYVGYGYKLKNNWWLKGGLQMQWWRKGVATSKISQQNYAVSNPGEKSFTASSAVMNIQSDDWNSFQKFQVNVNVEALYTFKQWETAFRIGVPISPISDVPGGPKNSLRTEFVLRLALH